MIIGALAYLMKFEKAPSFGNTHSTVFEQLKAKMASNQQRYSELGSANDSTLASYSGGQGFDPGGATLQ